MKRTIVATYIRKSTLWKNANAFYKMNDWTKMECIVYDYSEEKEICKDMRWVDKNGVDITDVEFEKRYGKPFVVNFSNDAHYSKSVFFKTRNEANNFVQNVLNDKVLGNFKRV